MTTEALYPFTTGTTGDAGSCNMPLLRSIRPGQVVRLGEESGFVYPWANEAAIKEVRMAGCNHQVPLLVCIVNIAGRV